MRYENVYIEGTGYITPEKVVTTAWIEEQLKPVYKRLMIPNKFFERITGIEERRWWPDGWQPSDGAAEAGRRAIANADVPKEAIDVVIYAGVCKDYIEPANAVFVHDKIGLRQGILNFDVTNACLGFLNGMVMVANMIELGQIETGLVVAAESPEEGQRATIDKMLKNGCTKDDIRDNLASFTLGSAGVGMVLTKGKNSKTGKKLLGGAHFSGTQHNKLCVAQRTWMKTNSQALLDGGTDVVMEAWDRFLKEMDWNKDEIAMLFTHQVSEPQRRKAMRTLKYPVNGKDYPILKHFGNCGAAAAPLAFAMGVEEGVLNEGDKVCLLGVGSGINSLILGVQW
ncbi:MAG: 3-oxoacyl-ACP synthase III [Anaerolineae bacterium]|jgi:3-oxoacyl-[acyl-carrier-protein] synthase-3|nr:3-oxoacyl-ACP synthase III [Anaerolineae bacterium]